MQSKSSKPSQSHSVLIDASKLLGIEIPSECRAGIETNMELFRTHARILDDYVAGLDPSWPTQANRLWQDKEVS